MSRIRPLLALVFFAAACLAPGPATARVTAHKLAALEPAHEGRMRRHEERLRRMEATVAAYDPAKRLEWIDRRVADLDARHDVRVARGAELARADALARDAALDRTPTPGGPKVTPWIDKPPRR